MIEIVTGYSTNLFRAYIIKRFMAVFFYTDIEEKRKEKVFYIFFVVLTGTVNLLLQSAFANILTNVLAIYFITCLYEGKKKKKILITLLIYGINAICDVLSVYSLNNYEYGKGYSEITSYITVFFIGICEFIVEHFFSKRSKADYLLPCWKILFLIPIISIVLLMILILNDLNNRYILVFMGAGILYINLLIFYLYDILVDSYLKLEEKTLFERQAASYENQLNVMSKSEEKIRALQHDLKHHLGELLMIAECQKAEDIKEYIQSMQMYIENPYEYISSGNKDVDSLLNYLLGKAEKKLYKVEYKINVPKKIGIRSFDFNIIIGNLLENAILASSYSKEKWLVIELIFEKGILFIHIQNSYDAVLQKNGDVYITTKMNNEKHGIGLQNVKRVVDSYNGTIQLSDSNYIFDVKVMLYTISSST